MLNVVYDPFLTRKSTLFQKRTPLWHLFYSVRTFARIRQHCFSKYWRRRMHGPSLTSNFWGTVPPVPPRSRPWIYRPTCSWLKSWSHIMSNASKALTAVQWDSRHYSHRLWREGAPMVTQSVSISNYLWDWYSSFHGYYWEALPDQIRFIPTPSIVTVATINLTVFVLLKTIPAEHHSIT